MNNSPNKVTINLSALTHNLGQVRTIIGPETRIMGIVKSDAYGHGMIEISRHLEKISIFSLGVAFLEEGLALRRAGIRLPVTVLCGVVTSDEADALVENSLTPVVFDTENLELLNEAALRRHKVLPVHLKIDTGMGRLGFPCSEVGVVIKKTMGYKALKVEAFMSHLSSADDPDTGFTNDQIKAFQSAVETGRSMGLDLQLNHLANSGGLISNNESHFDLVRPGIMIYGGLPSPDFQCPMNLKPVMGFAGRVIQVRDLPDNTPVSYGHTYFTKGAQKIAVISAGYADGLPRALSSSGKVLIGGKKAQIVGRVCMNMFMCNISGFKDVKPGDEAVLLGLQEGNVITGDEIAGWANTISYEIFCSIGRNAIKEFVE